MCKLLYRGHDKQSHWSTSSTYQSCWYTSRFSELVCIPFQSYSYSVHTNVGSKNHMITASDNCFGLVYYRYRQRSKGMNSWQSGKVLSSIVLGFRTVLTLPGKKKPVLLFSFQIMQSNESCDSVLRIFTDPIQIHEQNVIIFSICTIPSVLLY
jgi:hypothetical protein